jgi:hypothetical protein
MSQNELALQFMQTGVFNPQQTDQTLMMLDMMDFKGKDELVQKVQGMGTMQDTLVQVGQIALALAQQYNPAVAQQLGLILQGVAADIGAPMMQQMAGGGGKAATEGLIGKPMSDDATQAPQNAKENGIVRNARERVANATRPD